MESVTCHQIDQALACHQSLTPMQSEHIETCPLCMAHRATYQQLDKLMATSLSVNPPDHFADRVMSVIETSPVNEYHLFAEKLLASLPLRICLVSGAAVILIGHIVRFILSTVFVTMAAT
ncbi:MAG: hypothetical protein GXP08_00555 [Gammaproteobacteria bacterium]|nr:hypothetical protein [Gammaproteobacteria bacterium]